MMIWRATKGRPKYKSTRQQKKGNRQHNKYRLLEPASKWEAGELEELRLKSRNVTSSISTQPHSRKETGAEIIIETLSVRYLRTVEKESELDRALDEMKFDITELSSQKIRRDLFVYICGTKGQMEVWFLAKEYKKQYAEVVVCVSRRTAVLTSKNNYNTWIQLWRRTGGIPWPSIRNLKHRT